MGEESLHVQRRTQFKVFERLKPTTHVGIVRFEFEDVWNTGQGVQQTWMGLNKFGPKLSMARSI